MTTRSRAGIDSRKQAVSIRMSGNDVRQIKRLAERLGARDSDVVRFAIKMMLARLSPLHDPAARGRALVPVLVDSGAELMRHFDIDAARLTGIVNEGAESERRVDPEDIQLLSMTGVQRSYLKLRVAGLRRALNPEEDSGGAAAPASGPNGARAASIPIRPGEGSGAALSGRVHDERVDFNGDDPLGDTLRQYLWDKYFSTGATAAGEIKNSRGEL
jgi:Arc/MetJ-type ribon-helix-helix transcriptional regulator